MKPKRKGLWLFQFRPKFLANSLVWQAPMQTRCRTRRSHEQHSRRRFLGNLLLKIGGCLSCLTIKGLLGEDSVNRFPVHLDGQGRRMNTPQHSFFNRRIGDNLLSAFCLCSYAADQERLFQSICDLRKRSCMYSCRIEFQAVRSW